MTPKEILSVYGDAYDEGILERPITKVHESVVRARIETRDGERVLVETIRGEETRGATPERQERVLEDRLSPANKSHKK